MPIPAAPVTIIVPFAAGGSADVYARLLVPRLQATLGQSFIVDDRPTAPGAIIGTEYVKNAPADGYTLLLISNTHTVNETLFVKKPFKSDDGLRARGANQLLRPGVGGHGPNLGAKSVARVDRDAPRQNPVRPEFRVVRVRVRRTTWRVSFSNKWPAIDILHVPYKGSSPARIDVISGQVDMMFDATTTMTGASSKAKQGRGTGHDGARAKNSDCLARTFRPCAANVAGLRRD